MSPRRKQPAACRTVPGCLSSNRGRRRAKGTTARPRFTFPANENRPVATRPTATRSRPRNRTTSRGFHLAMPRPPCPSDLPQVPNDLVRHPTGEDDDAADLSEEDRDPVDGRQHDYGALRRLDLQEPDERRLILLLERDDVEH